MHESAGDRSSAAAQWEAEAGAIDWITPFSASIADGETGLRWFPDGTLNVAANCVDRHAVANPDRIALLFEGEPGDRLSLTYAELAVAVERFASALHGLGVGPGDRVALYLGMIPETVVAMLACARIGAVHTVLASALPAEALGDRLSDFAPKVLVTADAAWRRGVLLPLKARADEALSGIEGVQATIVVRRTGVDVAWYAGDRWYHDVPAPRGAPVPAIAVAADHPLLVVYLGSRRGRPTGFVHRSGGLLVQALALQRGLTASPTDVFWCAMDLGWMSGQAHGVYGALASGATTVLYEGTLDTPDHDRAWAIIQRYRVDSLVTSPSVVRNLHQWVDSPPDDERLRSLRHIVTAGEEIAPAVQEWLATKVGGGHAVIRDGWGQTELGAVVTVSPPPDPPLPDIGVAVVGPRGDPVGVGEVGTLVLRAPLPGAFLGIWGDGDPARTARYDLHPGSYSTGDRARRLAGGVVELLGRTDPVIQVLGQLVSANEVRAALQEHPFVQTAVVVAQPDPRRGQVVVAGVVPSDDGGDHDRTELARELRAHVQETLGGLARPRTIAFIDTVPTGVRPGALRRAFVRLSRDRTEPIFAVGTDELQAALDATDDDDD
jgi:acetyl-CoA synthetase